MQFARGRKNRDRAMNHTHINREKHTHTYKQTEKLTK